MAEEIKQEKTVVSASPHIRAKNTTTSIMGDVIIALIPAGIVGIYNSGLSAFLLILTCVVSSMFFEYLSEKIMHRKLTVRDLSAALTGLLLALNLPAGFPLWMAVLGSAFAIIVVKQMFGGIGQNFMNPALAARCFLMMSFAKRMTHFTYDGVTTATPLAVIKSGGKVNVLSMFLGNEAGTIGETSVIALLIGALYLVARKVIDLRIPVFYIGSFVIFVMLYKLTQGAAFLDVTKYTVKQVCGGGLILGAFFMATDYTTSPINKNGRIIYGIILGFMTFIFRMFGSSAEGVSYAIIISNLLVPLIEMATKPKSFGAGYENKSLKENRGFKKSGDEVEDKKEKSIRVVFAICLIGLFSGLALGLIHDITKKPIEETATKKEQASYKAVFDSASTYEENADVLDKINKILDENGYTDADIDKVLSAKDENGNEIGLILIITTHKGYAGDIQMAVGIDKDCQITGISMLSIGETPNLGMEARDNPDFTAQYVGKDVDKFTVTKNGAATDSEINAISGATITSNAVTGAVNTSLFAASKIYEGGIN